MMKKIFLMTVYCAIAIPKINTKNDNSATAIVACAGVLGTAVYWATRESNDSVITRAQLCIKQNQLLLENIANYISKKDINRFSEAELLAFQVELRSIYQILSVRYNSYMKPWNWSFAMKEALVNTKNVLESINLCLYRYTIERIHDFQFNSGRFLDPIIAAFRSQDTYNIIVVLQQNRMIKLELEQYLQISSALNTELLHRGSTLSFTQKDIHAENIFNIYIQQLSFLNIVLKYADCILKMDQEEKLTREARKIIGSSSSYPIKDFVAIVEQDIYALKRMATGTEFYVNTGIELLIEIKKMLLASNEYAVERRAYEAYLEQKRLTEAAIRSARAAQESAEAALHQARIAEERNRIERERNRIEQERNNIERNKQRDSRNNNDDRW